MLSVDLRQILPPKIPFFVRQKVQISSTILPQIPNFANFVKFRRKINIFCHDGWFASFRQFFVKNEILWSLHLIDWMIGIDNCRTHISGCQS